MGELQRCFRQSTKGADSILAVTPVASLPQKGIAACPAIDGAYRGSV